MIGVGEYALAVDSTHLVVMTVLDGVQIFIYNSSFLLEYNITVESTPFQNIVTRRR